MSFLASTSKFKVENILYKAEGFAVVSGQWIDDDGVAQPRIACRWYEGDIGYPQTFGKPQWMLLPIVRVDQINVQDPSQMGLVLHFPPTPPVSESGPAPAQTE